MTLWSALHANRNLISRTFYPTAGTTTITAPTNAGIIRASCVGAGGYQANAQTGFGGFPGGGAAFARVKRACASGDQFSVQVGDWAHANVDGDSLGDSIVKLLPSGTVILQAERGHGPSGAAAGRGGLASNSIGDTCRDGSSAQVSAGVMVAGASAGDDADAIPLGFGGRGALDSGRSDNQPAAAPGGGGVQNVKLYSGSGGYVVWHTFPPGHGLVCVEFFKTDPGY